MENVILLADKKTKAWDFAKKIQNYIQEQKNSFVSLKEVSICYFRNKEIDMYVPENVRKKEVYYIQDSAKNPQDWWVELLLIKDLLLSASAGSVSLVLPNILYSRKDRKEKPHVPISARALAKSISSGITRIITMDLHSPQIQGFYPEKMPLDNLHSFPVVVNYLKEKKPIKDLEKLVVFSPDAGGVDRARAFANKLGAENPIGFLYKRRIKAGEISDMLLVGDIYGKDILIVDDIIDSGGTLCSAAKILKENGAGKLYCYGTHGLFTKGTKNLNDCFDLVMTSNTHYKEENSTHVIDVSSVFAEAIYRAQKGLSISELFE